MNLDKDGAVSGMMPDQLAPKGVWSRCWARCGQQSWQRRLAVAGASLLLVGTGLLGFGGESRADTVNTRSAAGREVSISAQTMDVDLSAGTAKLEGAVKVASDGLELECPVLDLRYDARSFEISWAKASGGVQAKFEGSQARSSTAEFDLKRRVLVLSGGVTLLREGGKIEARSAELNLADHRVRLLGVSGTLPLPAADRK